MSELSIKTDQLLCRELLVLFKQALQDDTVSRNRFRIKGDYDFIPQHFSSMIVELEALLEQLERIEQEQVNSKQLPESNTVTVYVYLYNDHGQKLRHWEAMLLPETLSQFSVNRPIYERLEPVERLLRTREYPENHACLAVKIKQEDLVERHSKNIGVDALGQSLIRVKQGSLLVENITEFRHNGKIYELLPTGRLREKV